MVACHVCDNRKCVNPDHIFIDTQQNNVKDAISKGRIDPVARARLANASKIIPKEVYASVVNDLQKGGMSQQTIANKHNISQRTVCKINQGKHHHG
jgi:ribosome-binding protein aMBF1 (putative translation factor)